MKRLKGIVLAMMLAGLCLSAGAPSWGSSLTDALWMGRTAENLLSSEFLGTLGLSTSQLDSMRGLLGYSGDADRSVYLGSLQQVVDLLASGGSVGLDGRRSIDGNIDSLLRGDDEFLRRYYEILNPNQRVIVGERLAQGDAGWEGLGWKFGKVRWEMSKDLERQLNLSKSQKKELGRILRDASADQREREKRLREQEREYYKNTWDHLSGKANSDYRRQLMETRRNTWLISSNTRDRIRSILDSRQRAIFDSWQVGVYEPYSSNWEKSTTGKKKTDTDKKSSGPNLKTKPTPGSDPTSNDLEQTGSDSGSPSPGKGKNKDNKKNN